MMKKLIRNAVLVFFYTLFLVHSAYGALWHKNVMDFYGEGARHIFEGATKEGVRTVVLLPEVNKSKYHCACPCNEGIALALYKIVNSENHGGCNIVLWRGDIASFRGWAGRLFLSGKKVDAAKDAVSPKGGWHQPERNEKGEYQFAKIARRPSDAYAVRLIIEDVELDKDKQRVKTLFKIEKEDGEALIKGEYSGSTKQLRWFITEKPESWLFYVLSLLFVLSCLWLVRSMLLSETPNPETMILVIFILIGVLISLLLIYINPFHRENAAHYEQTSLVFMVDNNSEIFFPSESNNPSESLDLVYIIKKTCLEIGQRFAPDRESSIPSGFWQWCRIRLPRLLYGERRYELNSRCGYLVHTVSGAGRDYTTMYQPLRSEIDFNKVIKEMCNGRGIREPRLIIPQEELDWIERNQETEMAREGNQYVIFYTSASAPCQEDVNSYVNRVTKHIRRGATRVFSIFLPTIPRTGLNSHYNYQQGKLSLLRQVSNHIVGINSCMVEDIDSCIPIFKRSNLGTESHEEWDVPQDLKRKRIDYFVLSDKIELDKNCERIVQEFERFVRGVEPVSHYKKELLIQVLVNNRFLLISMIIIVGLVGFGMFSYYQYNTTSLNEWENNPNYRKVEYGCLVFSYLALLFLASYWILYSGDDPQRTVYFGYPKLVFGGTIGFWLCFFFAPFIVFRFHLVGKRPMGKGSMELKWALLSSLFLIVVIMIALLEIPQRIDNTGWRLIATIGVSIAPLLIVFLLDLIGLLSGVIPEQTRVIPVPGKLAWWRKPFMVSLIKLSVGLCLAFVLYGSLWASPGSPSLKFPLFPLNCSYYVLALLGGGLWAMIGIAIWAVYRYKMN